MFNKQEFRLYCEYVGATHALTEREVHAKIQQRMYEMPMAEAKQLQRQIDKVARVTRHLRCARNMLAASVRGEKAVRVIQEAWEAYSYQDVHAVETAQQSSSVCDLSGLRGTETGAELVKLVFIRAGTENEVVLTNPPVVLHKKMLPCVAALMLLSRLRDYVANTPTEQMPTLRPVVNSAVWLLVETAQLLSKR
jgi:hypothetical protein